MTDAPSSEPGDDGSGAPAESTDAPERPERPPSARLVDALGVVDHARRGLVVGLALALGVFGFFVLLPIVDPSTPARPESPVLYLALAFVVATSATLLVGSALAVRAVAGRVMAYAKWVRRAAAAGALGGASMVGTGILALAVATDVGPGPAETVVLSALPLSPLLVVAGAWAALARTGVDTGAAGARSEDDGAGEPSFDHALARPRLARTGAVLALAGVAALHVAAFLETPAFLGETAPALASLLIAGTLALAAGTVALATALSRAGVAGGSLGLTAALAVGAVLGAIGAAVTATSILAPVAALVAPGLAWLALGVAVTRDPGSYPERPV